MTHRIHFAGINTPGLAEAAKGQDALVSFADVKLRSGFWRWAEPMIRAGHFRSVILDSGAFTELSQRKLGKVFKVEVGEFAAFAARFQGLFTWVANLDDIEGNVTRSNANYERIAGAGVANLVPVFHETESPEQLEHCIALARAGRGIVALGGQRPKGKLIPRNVVRFLAETLPCIDGRAATHGFGLTRYASSECPCNGPAEGFALDTTDSTTWIAEGCSLERSGAFGTHPANTPERSSARSRALQAAVASYGFVPFAVGPATITTSVPAGMDVAAALEYGHQAATVARRLVSQPRRIAA